MFNKRFFVLIINGLVCAELICFAVYSVYMTNLSLINMAAFLLGGMQVFAVVRNKIIRFNITILVLTLHVFLAFGFFFRMPETHWKPNLTHMQSIALFILTELILLGVIWMCSKEKLATK